MKVGARGQPGPFLKPPQHLFLRGPGVGRGLHDHRRAPAKVTGQGSAGRLDVAQVGQAVPQRRGHGDHGDVEVGARSGVCHWAEAPRLKRLCELAGRHVLDVGLPGLQSLHPISVDVVADYLMASRYGPHCQREAYITQAYHYHGAHQRTCADIPGHLATFPPKADHSC